MDSITILELHGHAEEYAIAKAIEARMEALINEKTDKKAVAEYLTLHQIQVRMIPSIGQRKQVKEQGWLL